MDQKVVDISQARKKRENKATVEATRKIGSIAIPISADPEFVVKLLLKMEEVKVRLTELTGVETTDSTPTGMMDNEFVEYWWMSGEANMVLSLDLISPAHNWSLKVEDYWGQDDPDDYLCCFIMDYITDILDVDLDRAAKAFKNIISDS